jgi:hypothetical protein
VKIVTTITEIGAQRDDDLGSAQAFGLPKTAPISLVREVLTYALMADKGYFTQEAFAADGWEFSPEGPAWYDGEGEPQDAAWCWDWQQLLPEVPKYNTGR